MRKGQGGAVGLNVDVVQVFETGDVPADIIPEKGEFQLALSFETVGALWASWAGDPFKVFYYAEGIGEGTKERDLGYAEGVLKAGPDKYGAPETTLTVAAAANDLTPGVYRIAAVVTFPNLPGITGFTEDLLIQVY